MNQELEINTSHLPESSISSLGIIQNEREALINAYDDVINLEITEENIKVFKELRLQIRDNRTKGIEPWHTANKAVSLAIGRTIDSIKNREVEINKRMEQKLLGAEKHFENLEKERIEKLNKERIEKVRPFLEDVYHLILHDMEDDVFESYLEVKKRNFKAIKEAEEKAEAERIKKEKAEAEENERIRIENERLKKEAKQKEESRIQQEKERAKKEKIEAERLAKIEAEKQEKLAKERAKQDAIIKKEREEKEKLQAKLKAKQDAEIKAKKIEQERLEQERLEQEKLAKAPIKEQLIDWIDNLKLDNPPVFHENAKDILNKFNGFKKWAKTEIDKI